MPGGFSYFYQVSPRLPAWQFFEVRKNFNKASRIRLQKGFLLT